MAFLRSCNASERRHVGTILKMIIILYGFSLLSSFCYFNAFAENPDGVTDKEKSSSEYVGCA